MEKLKSLYIDRPTGLPEVCVDDFLVTIGAKKSNSVYHVAEVKAKPRPNPRITRYYVKVLDTDLMTALNRDFRQQLITLYWYKR
jgi:acyl-ACP thioesterase